MADGSVEIKITGSVDRSVAASANEAKAAYSDLGNSVSVSSKAMAAALAATGGNVKAITPAMLGLAAARDVDAAATAVETAAQVTNTVATEASTRAAVNSRSVYEGLALVHEAMAGRFTRMASTSLIFGQALAGQAATTNAVAFATSAAGIAILGTVAALGAATVATIQYEREQANLKDNLIGIGSASAVTADQLQEIGSHADSTRQSISETTKAALAFADAGVQNKSQIDELANSVQTYASLIGGKFADAEKSLADAMKDPVRGAKELHEQLGILNGDQLEQIQRLSDLGDKQGAVTILVKAYIDRINEANRAGVGAAGSFGHMANELSDLWHWFNEASDAAAGFAANLVTFGLLKKTEVQAKANADALHQQAVNQRALNVISAQGAAAYDATPEGEAIARKTELIGKLNQLKDALKVDTATQGENSEAVKHDKEGIEDFTHAVTTYLAPAEKKLQADQLDVKIAAARHEHNKQLVKDLTEQKGLLEEAGKVETDAAARANAAGKGDVAGAKTFAPKGGKGPSIVSEWQEQLHAAEVASGEFFKDQTADELKFWQDKVGLVKAGSKDWLDVQAKIYEAQKSLAHQSYDEHLADLNVQLEADRDNWKKEQADWQEKLAFIKSKNGEQSTAYKDAYRQFEAAQREHDDAELRAQREIEQKERESLKQHLAVERQIREEDARAAEEAVQSEAQGRVLAEVTAAAKIGQIHRQLEQQELADTVAEHAAEDIALQAAIDRAKAKYGEDVQHYKKALADKAAADQAFQEKIRQLAAKARAQEIADIQALKQAYHQYIDGVVGATVTGFASMLAGTESWHQAVAGVFNSLLGVVEQVVTRMIANWLVNLVVGKAASTATAVGEIAANAAVAASAAYASTAAIPIIGPELAPEAAAAAYAGAIGWESAVSAASLAVGTNELPRDMLVQAHEGERIIPKADNRKLFEALQFTSSGAANTNAPAAANDGPAGDVHFNFYSVIPPDRREIRQFLMEHHDAVGAAARKFVRANGNVGKFGR